MYVKSIKLDNFMCYEQEEIELDPGFNSFVGISDSGKAQPLNSIIWTPSGPMTMGEMTIDQVVSTPDGRIARVNGIYPQGDKEIYRLICFDGSSTLACGEHLWKVKKYCKTDTEILTTNDLRANLEDPQDRTTTWAIPLTDQVYFTESSVPLDPYILGVLIGDGSLTQGCVEFTNIDLDVVDEVRSRLSEDYCLSNKFKPSAYRIVHKDHQVFGTSKKPHNPYTKIIKNLGLNCHSYEKFIPKSYIYNSPKIRMELLSGLMDTDGSITAGGSIEYYTTSQKLSEDVRLLVESLGGYARIRTKKNPQYTYNGEKRTGRTCYILAIKLPREKPPFYCKRKLERWIPDNKIDLKYRYIKSIEYVGIMPAQCITIDHPDQLYLTDHFIVTHNSTILRALIWVFFNRPTGMEMCRTGTSETRVQLTLDDGNIIEKIRSKNRNAYSLTTATGTQLYETVKTDVPKEVTDVLGVHLAEISPKVYEMLNVSRQMDGPFMLSSSSVDSAKILGNLSGIVTLDQALSSLKSDTSNIKKQLEAIDKLEKTYAISIIEFQNLDSEEQAVVEVGKLVAKAQAIDKQLLGLRSVEERVLSYNKIVTTVDSDIALSIERLEAKKSIPKIDTLLAKHTELVKIEQAMKAIGQLKTTHEEAITNSSKAIAIKQEEYQNLLHEAGVCPTCGGET